MSTPGSTDRLTHDEVVSLVGALDDSTIASIVSTGATYADIEQALEALGCEVAYDERQSLSPAAEAVHDILSSDPAFSPTDRSER